MDDLRETIRGFILEEFLPGEAPDELTDVTPLVSGRILDSLATLKLVAFLEDRYGVRFQPHEVSGDAFETVESLASLVASKRGDGDAGATGSTA